MKKIIIMLGLAGMAITSAAQTKTNMVATKNTTTDSLTNNIKRTNMKDYVFILRLKAITPEIISQVGPKWAILIPKWTAEGHFVGNSVMVNEGHLISSNDRLISNAPVANNGLIILDVFRIKAKNMDQALELAKLCPTLDVGGSVEVREVQPTPDIPVK
jgi:hypothetical protein